MKDVLTIIRKPDIESTSIALKHIAIDVLNLDFKSRDAPLLKELNLFSSLLNLAIPEDLLAPKSPGMPLKNSKSMDIKEYNESSILAASDSSVVTEYSDRPLEQNPKQRQQRQLQRTAWLCFRLLSTRCCEVDESGELTEEILKLLDNPLTRAEKYFYSLKRSKDESLEPQTERILLLLICLSQFGQPANFLSKSHRIRQLVSLLKHGSLRIKLLSFRYKIIYLFSIHFFL